METGEEYFTDAVDEARKLEKKAMKYKSYDGEVKIRHDIDLYPADYVDIDYRDLINIYDRAQKIKKAAKMKIYAAAGMPAREEAPPPKKMSETEAKKISEVESRLRGITSEALKKAEEIASTGRPPELEKEAPEAKPAHLEIELEKEKPVEEEVPSEFEIEFEEPPEKEIEKPEPPEAKPEVPEEAPEEPSIAEKIEEEEPAEEKAVMETPEMLEPKLESVDEAAEKKFKQIEVEVKSTMEEKADEKTIKKKMLELTKQLFKEKSMDRREEIKHEIAALKNMLAGKRAPARKAAAKAKGKKAPKEAVEHLQVLQTLVSTQESELAQTKDEITSSFRHKIDGLKEKFDESIAVAETSDEKKKLYDNFVFEITKLSERLPDTLEKFRDYNTRKHLAELKKLRQRVGPKEKDVRKQVDENIDDVETKYSEEFDVLKNILSKRMDGVIKTASRDVFEKKPEEERTMDEQEEAKVDDVISEISNTDPGTLLYYLHSKDSSYYKKYERKHVSKAEALSRARVLMAKEKGLNDELISKYFGTLEG